MLLLPEPVEGVAIETGRDMGVFMLDDSGVGWMDDPLLPGLPLFLDRT